MAESSQRSAADLHSDIPVPLIRTPLFDLAINLNARMTAFSGWEMPVQYSSISREHQAVRSTAGMFDISHMGKFALTGNVLEQIQRLVPSDLSRLQPGQAQYTVLLNPQAGIIDDLIFYYQGDREGQQRWVAIVNASTSLKDKTWMLENLDTAELEFEDLSPTKILLAVQGPTAVNQLQPLVAAELSTIKPFGHLEAAVLGHPGFLARTGYTGEDGFEVMVDPDVGLELWRSLLASGVVPCGLGARDTLRLEAAMALYGQDIDDTTTPLEAGLGWLVHLDTKGEFIGRSVLEQQKRDGVQRRLVGLQMQGRNIARHGYPVVHEGKPVGEVTSGTQSPTLGQGIALAYVPTALSKIGQELTVEIRGKLYGATVVKRPFYR
ncbi:glycine cleavage system aminomethyltransferase GcvT [Leptolyngbya sp. FACHB-36]|uniref:glycine cleavage system aminomethyltransferase GcvT n=1 Tax=Leptolyngbya sp. FACHB-36 TaxID=2692808 RepID=UPI001680F70F|nr:glycine cleavage system aminomethyltransferase GcvT [Leptolyngbya sp. FACHB-36]MBD2022260.1 glycine cleavage system aminomethyltransferase GcvT [Leptolyngbya sp. FACHB-36]